MTYDPSSVKRDHLGQPVCHTAHTVAEWLGYLTHAEIEALKALARSLPENPHVVNIGAGGGTSGLAFLESRADLRLTTIDVQRDPSPYGCLAGEEQVLRHAGLWDPARHTQIQGDSKAVGRDWAGGPVDLVFVDGDHSEAGARGDIEAWLPRIKPGGLIVIHDFDKEAVYFRAHPDEPHTQEVSARAVKAYRGVDLAVKALLLGRYEQALCVDTLIAFRIEAAATCDDSSPTTAPAPSGRKGRGRTKRSRSS